MSVTHSKDALTAERTELPDVLLLRPRVLGDARGYFLESYNERSFSRVTGCVERFVQDNQSFSSHGVLRGLHYQVSDDAQGKLVRAVRGAVRRWVYCAVITRT